MRIYIMIFYDRKTSENTNFSLWHSRWMICKVKAEGLVKSLSAFIVFIPD